MYIFFCVCVDNSGKVAKRGKRICELSFFTSIYFFHYIIFYSRINNKQFFISVFVLFLFLFLLTCFKSKVTN